MTTKKAYRTLKDWLGILQEAARHGGRVLPLASLSRMAGLSKAAARKALQRLARKKLIFRLGPSLYASHIFPPALEEVAMAVGRPCYVSFESALSRHGVLSQSPMLLTCATRRKPKQIRTAIGDISLRHIAPGLFWGFREARGVLWAEPEKALLDWVYWKLQTEGVAPELDEIGVEELDKKKLLDWSKSYPGTVRKALSRAF